MALFEYFCDGCSHQFEQITSSTDPDAGKCPKCQKKETRKLISRFAVGGRGDLRESTVHGCHGCHHGSGHSHHGKSPSQGPGDIAGPAQTTDGTNPASETSTPAVASTTSTAQA